MSKTNIQRCLELLSHFSLSTQYRVARAIAFVLRNTSNQLSRQTRANVDLCFAGHDEAERDWLYTESIRHTSYAMTELAAVWCWPPDKILAQITKSEICDEFEQSTRGRIILAPHLGSWETLALWLGRACNATMLYKRRKNKDLDQFILQSRARSGGTPVPTKKHGLRKLLVKLKDGGSLMILPDQRPARSKVHIESTFYGISAPTTTVVHNLCAKVDCDVFIATVVRRAKLGEFALRIDPLDHAQLAGDEAASAQYMNDQIEERVRQHVEQYQWGYARFAVSAYASVK